MIVFEVVQPSGPGAGDPRRRGASRAHGRSGHRHEPRGREHGHHRSRPPSSSRGAQWYAGRNLVVLLARRRDRDHVGRPVDRRRRPADVVGHRRARPAAGDPDRARRHRRPLRRAIGHRQHRPRGHDDHGHDHGRLLPAGNGDRPRRSSRARSAASSPGCSSRSPRPRSASTTSWPGSRSTSSPPASPASSPTSGSPPRRRAPLGGSVSNGPPLDGQFPKVSLPDPVERSRPARRSRGARDGSCSPTLAGIAPRADRRPPARHDHRRPARHRDGLSRVAHTVRAAAAGRRREAGRRRLARRVGHQDALLRLDPLRGDGRGGRGGVRVRRRQPLPAGPDPGAGLPRPRRARVRQLEAGRACSAVRASSATPTVSASASTPASRSKR